MVLANELFELWTFCWTNVICFRDIIERIFVFDFGEVVEKGFEQIFLWANTVVARDVICNDIWVVTFLKRNNKSIFCYVALNFFCLLKGQNLPVKVCKILCFTLFFDGSSLRNLCFLSFLLFGFDFVNNILRPVEIDCRTINIVSDFPPKSSFYKTLDQQGIVTFPNKYPIPLGLQSIILDP